MAICGIPTAGARLADDGGRDTATAGKPGPAPKPLALQRVIDSVHGHSGTGIALSFHLPGFRSIRYPPTQSRSHKKVRTRPVGTLSHGPYKNAFFETAVPPKLPSALTRYWNGSIFL